MQSSSSYSLWLMKLFKTKQKKVINYFVIIMFVLKNSQGFSPEFYGGEKANSGPAVASLGILDFPLCVCC